MDTQAIIDQVVEITREAGDVILSFYKSAVDVKEKSPDNPVTDADLASDTLLKEKLMALLPEAGWLSEETADNADRYTKKYLWVVDPLDGTKEFIMGIPEFTVAVALVEDGSPILSCIYNPVREEVFQAVKGHGGKFNGAPLLVTERQALEGARVEASRSERKRGEFEPFEESMEVITMGSIAYKLARLAAGMCDATWSRGPKWEWDVCAGVLLIQEAGGTCMDLDNNPMGFNKEWPKVNGIIASNTILHDAVVAALAPHRETARRD